MFQEHVICFSNVKSITFHTLELIHQLKYLQGGDGIVQTGVRASE
jgi:hypothetical protein